VPTLSIETSCDIISPHPPSCPTFPSCLLPYSNIQFNKSLTRVRICVFYFLHWYSHLVLAFCHRTEASKCEFAVWFLLRLYERYRYLRRLSPYTLPTNVTVTYERFSYLRTLLLSKERYCFLRTFLLFTHVPIQYLKLIGYDAYRGTLYTAYLQRDEYVDYAAWRTFWPQYRCAWCW